MKRFIFILVVIFVATVANAQNCTLKMTTGQTMQGTLIDATDSTVTFLMDGALQQVVLPAYRIKSGTLPHKGKLLVQDGKVVILTAEDIKASQYKEIANNPNYALGKALKVSGATSLGLGVPCLAAGLAACIAGNVMYVGKSGSGLATKSQLLETSYYLLPIGASLTIVGIPLYVEGKKIMEVNVNYTGNGIGLSMNF